MNTDTFDTWFSRFMWGTDIIFLVASMPHIAAWFAHFDNPGDNPWANIYAYGVGFGIAVAIDGVSFMLLLAITRMIKQGKTKDKLTMFGLIVFMGVIALLSWGINWQYDIQNASAAFAKADAVNIGLIPVGDLNPIIGGAFPILILAYALIGKAMQSEVKPVQAMSDEEFAAQKKILEQKKALAELRKNDTGTGLFQDAKKRLIGEGKDAESLYHERLNAGTDYMRNATDLLNKSEEKKAIELLAVFLKISKKESAVFLEAIRPILLKEKEPIPVQKSERTTGPLGQECEVNSDEHPEGISEKSPEEFIQETMEHIAIDPEIFPLIARYPDAMQLQDTSAPTIAIADVAKMFGCTERLVRNRADSGQIAYVKGKQKVNRKSVIAWAKTEMLSKQKGKIIDLETARNAQEQSEEKEA